MRLLRWIVAALLVLAVVQAPAASAAGSRTTSVTVDCDDAADAGEIVTCAVDVSDTDPVGTRTTPTGQVTWSNSTAASPFGASTSTCNLAPSAEAGKAACGQSYEATVAGTDTITASYPGDVDHAASSGTATVTVNPMPAPPAKRTVELKLECTQSITVGTTARCNVTLTDNDPRSGKLPVVGDVALSSTGGTGRWSPAVCTFRQFTTPVVCQATYTATSQGTHTLIGTYAGDDKHQAGTGSTTLSVTGPTLPSSTSVRCSAALGAPLQAGKPGTCVASIGNVTEGNAHSGGTVSWASTLPGAFSPATCDVTTGNGQCQVSFTPTGAGTGQITATWPGDNTLKASSGSIDVTVNGATLSAPILQRLSKKNTVSATCSTFVAPIRKCVASLYQQHKKVLLGKVTATSKGSGKSLKVKIKLNAAGRKLATSKSKKSVTFDVKATITAASGAPETYTVVSALLKKKK